MGDSGKINQANGKVQQHHPNVEPESVDDHPQLVWRKYSWARNLSSRYLKEQKKIINNTNNTKTSRHFHHL